MSPQTFLELSRVFNRIQLPMELHRELLEQHLARYSFFYDGSMRKHSCTYCRLTLKAFPAEKEATVKFLLGLQAHFLPHRGLPPIDKNLLHIEQVLQVLEQ